MFIKDVYSNICKIADTKPNTIAIYEDDKVYTYEEFNNWIKNRVFQIKQLNASNSSVVGMYVNVTASGYAAIYAAALCDLTYVPLPVGDPAERIAGILKTANIQNIFCDEENLEDAQKILSDSNLKINLTCLTNSCEKNNLAVSPPTEESPLCMLFTSGSTGTPNGVVITRKGVINFFNWAKTYFNVTREDVFLSHARLTFDVSLFSFYLPFMVGASVRVVKTLAERMYPGDLLKKDVTIAFLVPRVTGLMLSADQLKFNSYPKLKHLLLGGENLMAAQGNAWLSNHPSLTLHNMYGPTEATITCVCNTFAPGTILQDPISIGKELPQMKMVFFNQAGEIQQGPCEGEALISGPQVSDFDYFGKATKKFINHPILGRSFWSGDYLRRDENDNLFWISRLDDQIKIRGFRIELAEIDAALTQHPLVNELASFYDAEKEQINVLLKIDKNANATLVQKELIDLAIKKLPSYSRPRLYKFVDKIPMSRHGKIDRALAKKLFEP